MERLKMGLGFGILYRQSQAFLMEICKEIGLTYTEYAIMLHLYGAEGSSQDEIANKMMIDKALVARKIKTLEEKEFLFRKEDENNKRRKLIFLTEKAKGTENVIKGELIKWTEYLTDSFKEEEKRFLTMSVSLMQDRARKAKF